MFSLLAPWDVTRIGCRHRSAEGRATRVGDYVVETRCSCLSVPSRDRATIHKQQDTPTCFKRESADRFSRVNLSMRARPGLMAEHPSSGNIGPVKLALQGVPKRIFSDVAREVANKFDAEPAHIDRFNFIHFGSLSIPKHDGYSSIQPIPHINDHIVIVYFKYESQLCFFAGCRKFEHAVFLTRRPLRSWTNRQGSEGRHHVIPVRFPKSEIIVRYGLRSAAAGTRSVSKLM